MTDPSAKTMPLYTPADLQAAVAAALEEVAGEIGRRWTVADAASNPLAANPLLGAWNFTRTIITPDASVALAARDARIRRAAVAEVATRWKTAMADWDQGGEQALDEMEPPFARTGGSDGSLQST